MLGKSKSRSEDRDQTPQQIVLSLDSLSYRTGSGTSHPVVKERALLSCRKANRQSQTLTASELLVNTLISRCSAGLQPGILLFGVRRLDAAFGSLRCHPERRCAERIAERDLLFHLCLPPCIRGTNPIFFPA